MRRTLPALATLVALAALPVSAAHAGKTYNDPWLEGDLEQMRVPEGLDILARTPAHVIVGDVDTGARLNDPDLAPHLLPMTGSYTCASAFPDDPGSGPDYAASAADGDFGCDFIGTGKENGSAGPTTVPDGDPTDPFGHGSGTAAIIGAVDANGIEGAGVAPNARILPVRACYGNNPDCYDEPTLDGLQYAVDMGATIVNASSFPPDDSAIADLVHDNPDVLFDFATQGSGHTYPLCTDDTDYPNVICVGLAKPDDTPGTTNADKTTDVSAPGQAGVPGADGSRKEAGTTFGATAHVSGAAAILMGLNADLTPKQVRDVLVSTSRPVSGYATANMAHGIVDVEQAVRAVQSMAGFVTPAPGQGAASDSPDPFPPDSPTTMTPGGATTMPGAVTTPPDTTPAVPVTPVAPTPPVASPTLKLVKLGGSVRRGHTLKIKLTVSGGPATLTASLRHRKHRLASTKRAGLSGTVTVSLKLKRSAAKGRATLTLALGGGAKLTRTVKVK